MKVLNEKLEKELISDLKIVSKILAKYGELVLENGLVKKDVDPKKMPNYECVIKLTINPNIQN